MTWSMMGQQGQEENPCALWVSLKGKLVRHWNKASIMVLVILTCCLHDAGKTNKQEITDGISAARRLGLLRASGSLFTPRAPCSRSRRGLRHPLWPRRHKGPERRSFILINRAFLALIPSSVVHSLLGGKAHMDVFLFFLSHMVFRFHNSTSLPECLNT